MGTVYKGHHLRLDVDVAVKCLSQELADRDELFVARFEREARAAAKLNHPNVVRVFDVDAASELSFIVMEFVDGESVGDRVRRKGALDVEEAVQIVLGAARGLAQAHAEGMVHRDIKPDNILVSLEGVVKVADLGLVKPTSEGSGLTMSNVVMGTPQYMPPEQCRDASTVGPAADVYSLGATLFFLLTGKDAISAGSLVEVLGRIQNDAFPDVREHAPSVPAPLAELLARCVSKDPSDRPEDAGQLVRLLKPFSSNDESVLADDEGNSIGPTVTLVSPPPARTLARIRLSLAGERPASGAGTAEDTGAAQPSPDGQAAPRSSFALRAVSLFAGGLVLVVAALFGARWVLSQDPDQVAAGGTVEDARRTELPVQEERGPSDLAPAGELEASPSAVAAAVLELEQALASQPTDPCNTARVQAAARTLDALDVDDDGASRLLARVDESRETAQLAGALRESLRTSCDATELASLLEQAGARRFTGESFCGRAELSSAARAARERLATLDALHPILSDQRHLTTSDPALVLESFQRLSEVDAAAEYPCTLDAVSGARAAWLSSLEPATSSASGALELVELLLALERIAAVAAFSDGESEHFAQLTAATTKRLAESARESAALADAGPVLRAFERYYQAPHRADFVDAVAVALDGWAAGLEGDGGEASSLQRVVEAARLSAELHSTQVRERLLGIATHAVEELRPRVAELDDVETLCESAARYTLDLEPARDGVLRPLVDDLAGAFGAQATGLLVAALDLPPRDRFSELRDRSRALEAGVEQVAPGAIADALARAVAESTDIKARAIRRDLYEAVALLRSGKISASTGMIKTARRRADDPEEFLCEVLLKEAAIATVHSTLSPTRKLTKVHGLDQALEFLLHEAQDVDTEYDGYSARDWATYLRAEMCIVRRDFYGHSNRHEDQVLYHELVPVVDALSAELAQRDPRLHRRLGTLKTTSWGSQPLPLDPRLADDR